MTNIEKKKQLWEEILPQYEHLDCEIEVDWGKPDDIYFYPIFMISDKIYAYSQCDIECGMGIYSMRIYFEGSQVIVLYDIIAPEKIERIIKNIDEFEKKMEWIHNIIYGDENEKFKYF